MDERDSDRQTHWSVEWLMDAIFFDDDDVKKAGGGLGGEGDRR